MPPITPDSLTLITGANGFIAAHCISTLLHAGYNVRSTVRSAAKAQAALQALSAANVPSLQSHLELVVVPDPTVLEDVSRAVRGCGAILHLASAFSYDASPGEFEEKLMKPAVRGTETICRAALEHDSVKRVVIMSSFASVYDASLGLQPGRVYTETDWCPLSYEDGVNAAAVPIAYRASKVVAERAAWDFIRDHKVGYDLLTLCPGMVFGKMIHPIGSLASLNASNQIVWDVLKAGEEGSLPPTKAPVWIDVEDLAQCCLKALTYSPTGNERFLLTQGSYDTQEIADIVREHLPETKARIPRGEPGKRIADTHYSCDSSKAQRLLGVSFRGLEESIVPLARQLYAME